MKTNIQTIGNHCIYSISGDLDSGRVEELKSSVSKILGMGSSVVILDLKLVNTFDSTGIGALISIGKMMKANGNRFYLANIPAALVDLIEFSALDYFFDFFSGDLAEYIKKLRTRYKENE